jgi:hypothetical protein
MGKALEQHEEHALFLLIGWGLFQGRAKRTFLDAGKG